MLADGISSSNVSRIASESTVKGFLTDYYCTSEILVGEDLGAARDRGDQFLALCADAAEPARLRQGQGLCVHAERHGHQVARRAHLSCRRLRGSTASPASALEQLTNDHRVVISSEESYLGRALGVNPQIEIDYRMLKVEAGDVFVLATDGVYEHVDARFVARHDPRQRGRSRRGRRVIVAGGLPQRQPRQSDRPDRPDRRGAARRSERAVRAGAGAAAAAAAGGADGVRRLPDRARAACSSRSHIYLAVDTDNDALVVLKIPSIDLRDDPAYLKRFMMEEWVARRINSAHVLKPCAQSRKRNYLYVVIEFIEGQTLRQWMIDNPKPDLETVRGIVEQIASGLQAFHRMEMLHQDLRPDNIMIDKTGTVKIIDFGSTRVKGVVEAAPSDQSATTSSAPRSTPRRNISWARAARRAPMSSRSGSSPTRC